MEGKRKKGCLPREVIREREKKEERGRERKEKEEREREKRMRRERIKKKVIRDSPCLHGERGEREKKEEREKERKKERKKEREKEKEKKNVIISAIYSLIPNLPLLTAKPLKFQNFRFYPPVNPLFIVWPQQIPQIPHFLDFLSLEIRPVFQPLTAAILRIINP